MKKRKKHPNVFGVVRRVIPPHGIKIGCESQVVQLGLLRNEADELADVMQARYPDDEYAVIETVFRRWTK
jgi:hypothetical protein